MASPAAGDARPARLSSTGYLGVLSHCKVLARICPCASAQLPPTMRQRLQAPDTVTFVAATDVEVVGLSTLQGKEVRAVYARPEVQGQGVGSDLLGAVETEAKAKGIRKLEVSASLNSVGFYEAHGYERVGKGAVELEEGLEMRCIDMAKELA